MDTPPLRQAAGTLYAIKGRLVGKFKPEIAEIFARKFKFSLPQVFCKCDLPKTLVFEAKRLKKLAQS